MDENGTAGGDAWKGLAPDKTRRGVEFPDEGP
jgi:hypothetical protein